MKIKHKYNKYFELWACKSFKEATAKWEKDNSKQYIFIVKYRTEDSSNIEEYVVYSINISTAWDIIINKINRTKNKFKHIDKIELVEINEKKQK